MKDQIRCIKLVEAQGANKSLFGLLCQTQKEIRWISEKGDKIVFDSKPDRKLSDVDMIITQNNQIYFISAILSSQTNLIWEVCIEYNKTTMKFEASRHKVFTFQAGMVLSIQLDRDTEQQEGYNYSYNETFNDEYVFDEKFDCKTMMIALDTNYNFLKIVQKKSQKPFE